MAFYLGSIKLGNSVNKVDNKLVAILNDTIESLNAVDFGEISVVPEHMLHGSTSLKSVELPDTVETIKYSAFENCKNLSSINFPQGLKIIERYAFHQNESLKNVQLPEGLESIGDAAFGDCTMLESLNIPTTVTYLGTISGCTNLKSKITIPTAMTEIPSYMFLDCNSLTDIEILGDVTFFDYGTFFNCSSLKNVTVPKNLATMDDSVFNGCSSLEEIVLPNTLTTMGKNCFMDCSSLTKCELSSSLAEIPNNCFENCTSLPSITLPASITKINNRAFYGCSSLKEMIILATTPPTLPSSMALSGIELETIKVPKGTLEIYTQNASWSKYSSIIIEMEG